MVHQPRSEPQRGFKLWPEMDAGERVSAIADIHEFLNDLQNVKTICRLAELRRDAAVLPEVRLLRMVFGKAA